MTQKLDSVDDRLSDEEIVNEFIAFFFAGMDITANVASMMLYNLTQYPEYLESLEKERNETYNTEECFAKNGFVKFVYQGNN